MIAVIVNDETYFNVIARSKIVSAVRPKHFSFQYKQEYIFNLKIDNDDNDDNDDEL